MEKEMNTQVGGINGDADIRQRSICVDNNAMPFANWRFPPGYRSGGVPKGMYTDSTA